MTSANIRQAMTTCDPAIINEKNKTKPKENHTKELFDEHDVNYILSQLTNPIDPQIVRDTLTDNYGDIDGTIAYLLNLDIPPLLLPSTSPQPINEEKSNESIERIMSITGIYDVDLVQQSFTDNNLDLDSTVESLLKLKVNEDDDNNNNEETTEKSKTKTRPISNRQLKSDKKKAKKQRATEKHQAQMLAAASKQSEEKSVPPPPAAAAAANNEQEHVIPANMEFIRI